MRRTMNEKYDFCIARGARTKASFPRGGVSDLLRWRYAGSGVGGRVSIFHFFTVLPLTLRFCMHDPAGAVGGKEIDIYIWCGIFHTITIRYLTLLPYFIIP